MSSARKIKRNQTIHNQLKCKCGANVKFYKDITFKGKGTYHNVFWCKKCGRLYETKKEEGNKEQC